MKIIAFDLGSHMALATNVSGDVKAYHQHFKGTRVDRAAATLAWLQEALDQCRAHDAIPDVVVYERPFARGMDATRSLWGIAGMIEGVFGGVTAILDLSPQEIKKFSTGSGAHAKKGEKAEHKGGSGAQSMMLAAIMTGYPGDNEHEADAWCLFRMAEATFTKDTTNARPHQGRRDRSLPPGTEKLPKRTRRRKVPREGQSVQFTLAASRASTGTDG
jgi:hypothetical protein